MCINKDCVTAWQKRSAKRSVSFIFMLVVSTYSNGELRVLLKKIKRIDTNQHQNKLFKSRQLPDNLHGLFKGYFAGLIWNMQRDSCWKEAEVCNHKYGYL